MIAMSPGFVFLGQYWLEYFTVVSSLDNIGWYINRFCLSWTLMVGISPCFVCRGHYLFAYLPVLYIMNKNGWYITRVCLLWTKIVGISPFFCRGQNWLVFVSRGQ